MFVYPATMRTGIQIPTVAMSFFFVSVRRSYNIQSSKMRLTAMTRFLFHQSGMKFSSFLANNNAESPKSNASLIIDNTNDDYGENFNRRIWLGPNESLSKRVSRFINQPLGSLHHLDIKISSIDLIRECGKLGSFEGMKNAQDLLDRIIEEKKHVNLNNELIIIVPDCPFKMVMYGWANMCLKVPFATQRMREVLDLMIQEAEYDKKIKQEMDTTRIKKNRSNSRYNGVFEGLSCEPTVDIYNTLLQGLSKAASQSIQAAIEAEYVLSKMDKMNTTRGWHTKPNTRSYSLVLNAYAKTRHFTSGDRAASVLRKMVQRYEEEKQAYLEEYGVEYNTSDPETNEKCIVTPDTIAYSTVIQAFGRSDSDDSAGKASGLLNELIRSNNPLLQPDAFAFANTINAFSRKAAMKKSTKARFLAAKHAEDILWIMVDEIKRRSQMEATNDIDETLDNQQYNRLSGSIVPFNSCLNAWAQSSTSESPHRADDLLHQMLDPELQAVAKIYPNTVSFNTCMLAWSKSSKFEKQSSAPERAEELLNLLKDRSKENDHNSHNKKNWKVRPDVRSYVVVMNAYAISRRKDSVFHTHRLLSDLLQEVRDGYFDMCDTDKINSTPFTILLKAVANTKRMNQSPKEIEESAFGPIDEDEEGLSESIDPYSIALKTYSDLINDTYDLRVRADHFAFSEMLAVVESHTEAQSIERRQRVEEIFSNACQVGQVSSLVVRALQNACPNDIMLKDLLQLNGNDTVMSIESINKFPKQWTVHIPHKFRRVSSRSDHFQKKQKEFKRNKKIKKRHNSEDSFLKIKQK